MDATCVPADIRYPTDLGLLNEAREKTEEYIDALYLPLRGKIKKPRTYRKVARKEYLGIAKMRKPRKRRLRKATRKQLGYLHRNLKNIAKLEGQHLENPLTPKQSEELKTIPKLYQQQKYMYDHQTHHVKDRIVNISQPHVRSIVRGKARTNVEFGAKLAISIVDGLMALICKENGKQISAKYYREKYYYPALEQINIKKRTPHTCRHTFGNLMGRANADPKRIQEIIGYASYAFTKDIYTHPEIEEPKREIRKI